MDFKALSLLVRAPPSPFLLPFCLPATDDDVAHPDDTWHTLMTRGRYELGGSVITNTMLGDATLINLVIDGIRRTTETAAVP